jgi:hypothetical protein
VIGRLLRIVRLVGPRPLELAATFSFLLERRRRQQALRRSIVADRSRPAGSTLRLPAIELRPYDELPAALKGAADALRAEADAISAHRVDFLGSGPTALGESIDWHTDFKSGYTWPVVYYRDLAVTRLDDPSDAKVPWELSRGHQLLTLARAAVIFSDDRYADELERQLRSWLDANPPHLGINWVNPMEVALRAVNWIWALGTVRVRRAVPDELNERVRVSLHEHGRNIWANLEGTPYLRSNHYTADVLGLLSIGEALTDNQEAARWFRFGRRELEKSLRTQVYDDGVSFEGSLAYHGLVLEMFLLGEFIARRAGAPLPVWYGGRVQRMLDVSRAVRHPNGRIPLFGDQDSGRVLPAGFDRPPTHDNLLWLGAAILQLPRPLAGYPDEEVAWTLGIETWEEAAAIGAQAADPPSAFTTGRIYCLNAPRTHMVVGCGDLGQKGNGGHGHNDTFSFELSIDARPLIVDSGTYAYTFDVEARNAFRSTAAHNTVELDGAEINPIDHARVFELDQVARISVEDWEETNTEALLRSSHDGYARLDGIRHRRQVRLEPTSGLVEVDDTVDGRGTHLVVARLHLAADASVFPEGEGFTITAGTAAAKLSFKGAEDVEIVSGAVSDRYGVREDALVVLARVERELPVRLTAVIEPASIPTAATEPAG